MRFNLLGPFEILTDRGRIHVPGTPKMCQVLAVLLMRPGRVVSVETLVEELWGDKSPRSAVTAVQTYVYHSRRMLERVGNEGPEPALLHTQPPGYRMDIAPHEVDVQGFEELVHDSRALLNRGCPDAAHGRLTEADALWRGPVLAGVAPGSVLAGHIVHLEELRIRAIEMRIDASEQLGRHREIIPELRALVAAYPLNEWLHARLITALGRSGRRAEALYAYRELSRMLTDELGLEPGPDVRRIRQEVLEAPDPVPRLAVVDASGRSRPRRRPPFPS